MSIDIYTLNRVLARKLSRIRRNLGFSQEQMAKLLGMSRSYLAKLESGAKFENLSISTLQYMLQVCGVDIVDFFTITREDLREYDAYCKNLSTRVAVPTSYGTGTDVQIAKQQTPNQRGEAPSKPIPPSFTHLNEERIVKEAQRTTLCKRAQAECATLRIAEEAHTYERTVASHASTLVSDMHKEVETPLHNASRSRTPRRLPKELFF